MSDPIPQRLDPLTLPLAGERLIEASAGTGKTFTIGLLYLRLLLGLGQQAAYPRPLSVEEILVVTFTEAATAELRGRIRSNIHQLRIACVRGVTDDPMLQQLLSQIDDLQQAASMLLAAERQMDEAAIFTIHGFCQRMLNLNAFESGMLFEQQLIEDEHTLRRQATADFWRRHCYPLPLSIAQVVAAEWSGPDALLSTLSPWLQGESPTLKYPPALEETLSERHAKLIARINKLKAQWLAAAAELHALISDSGVDKRSYSSKHLPNWLDKIGQWAQEETQTYSVPKDLERFAQSTLLDKTKKGEAPRHALFSAVELFLAEPLSLRDLVIARALQEIRFATRQEKRLRAQLGFDDLLSRFDEALQQPGGPLLASTIRNRYPVALIDEFQDTDPQQYRIFRTLYVGQPESALLLIGDPKQAIYAFRGADIFTYMKARSEVSAHYTLDTNWRSSPSMIASVNQLFSRLDNPFLFREIPFLPVQAAAPNQALRFTVDGQPQPALRFWLQPGSGIGVSEYQQYMARQCAAEIRHWLSAGQQGKALIGRGDKMRAVQASDITILVRSYGEAAVMREALNGLNIPSVYLSNRDSVFSTPEARELLWLLQAVLAPEQERTLRSALATSILGLDALTLDSLSQDERAWNQLVDEFDHYRQHWLKRGVLPMLRELMVKRHIGENLLLSDSGERRLTDLLHLGELLQEAATQLDSEHALVRWLAQQIAQPDSQASNQQLRLESDRHLVQIVTIHKSKGLEYSLVWLPFVANFREAANGIYHDRQTFQALLDLQGDEESQQLAEQERLAEDLRLLYVALTRSIWHCSIGIAPLVKGNRKKEGSSDLHKSALGFLLQRGEEADSAQLLALLQQLEGEVMALTSEEVSDNTPWQPALADQQLLSSRQVGRTLRDEWRVTSYSGLQQHGSTMALDLTPRFDVDAAGEAGQVSEPTLTPHSFPRGASPGTFLHSLFENIDFSQPLNSEWLQQQLQQQGYDEMWLPVLEQWVERILATPLDNSGVSLNKLQPQQMQVELQFYLPINALLTAPALDKVMRQYDALSAQAPELNFHQVRGMLKGFIDLVFCWQGKYYLLDYKSNWLGDESAAYTPQAMEQAMIAHRYDLQYQLYTLALHRYLRHRLADYDYQHHFGGVLYLFLRGVDGSASENGVFHTRPSVEFVTALDQLFAASTQEATC
ncbi:exodeoxyribonuclease V subunit beta [Erwiniaceae bacterium BAC15a-03b]|uniref:RecBCD enzyme subunit RecB n=1 Tax=Winslowiella arboricola TaxID=2978220 RepID=A0A9J6PQJ7_9GAMM|nr:exodeoxyribonuclease V subunit beta [Winslowiella arboricola]MCU5774657.1 exodeoxyribonuclease V subunit beta [Winslowiella arboricola]MCU5777933.1 exodeoxyribonuclease V subunit beta [Winslowiella arboricola]